MARLVLSDASPLIALARVDGVSWLRALFGEVRMPRQVADEVLPGRGLPGEAEVAGAASDGWLRIVDQIPTSPRLPDLDEGEAACIRLALAQNAPALLLMDERAGREIAREYGLDVAGTAAVIGMARVRQLIPSARAVFERLHRSDFRISPAVIKAILDRTGECE